MDQTALFKACVKTIKTKNKALGLKESSKGSNILPTSRQKSEFSSKARNVLISITKLKEFLFDHRKDYINAFIHISSEMTTMTDQERDQIDTDAQTFMRTCYSAIRTLRQEASGKTSSTQLTIHREAVIEIMDTYLKAVCKMYSEQRAIRVKKVVDKKRISRLQPDNKKRKKHEMETSSSTPQKLSVDFTEDGSGPSPGDEQKLTAEEVQMFEQENKTLFDQMNSLVDEVRSIEGKVVEISKLQEIFSEKVLHQSGQIEKIHGTAVGTTENVQDGNEQIREAIKNNAGFRVWILFFLVMCSFSLLFLDWYS